MFTVRFPNGQAIRYNDAKWLNGKPCVATHKMVDQKWGGPAGFGCALCGTKFQIGDTFRFVYMNGASPSPGNFLVCLMCDLPDLADRIRSALSRHKPHMEEWVLLYQLQETIRRFEEKR